MQIKTGMVKDGRVIEVELNEADGQEQFPKWPEMDLVHRFKVLTAFGDLLVVNYAKQERLLPEDYANQRLGELAAVIRKTQQ